MIGASEFEPRRDVLYVELDPLTDELGPLLYRPASSKSPVRIGTVLQSGPGRWEKKRFIKTAVAPGDRVAFFEANLETGEGKALAYCLEEGFAAIRERDVLYVLEEQSGATAW